ncbi:hypothetical protein AAFF_G00391340 [Aldrovandia affinis]|uniref:Reverse transcriptase/retrotransposon-derived protein RNase H-like domain-containing protein n=1 Tax=Aldrovandia affinis TaxID=143900 RepID=A0AAD7SE24_9TELE|nr:hypothetical protein AAFF_G00391340 [Aldrovandia affinis]
MRSESRPAERIHQGKRSPGLPAPTPAPIDRFGLPSNDFLGHHITKDGAIPLPSKGKAPNHGIDWSVDMAKAFMDTKQALAYATMLAHPLPGAPIALTTDASDYAIAAVLKQLVGGVWRPLAFFSSAPTSRNTTRLTANSLASTLP